MTISFWQKRKVYDKYDAVIVGGGICGLMLSFHLLNKFPKYKIALIDQAEYFTSTSGRNAGFLSLGGYSFLNDDLELNAGINILKIATGIEEMEHSLFTGLDFKHAGTHLVYNSNEIENYEYLAKRLESIGINTLRRETQFPNSNLKSFWYKNAWSIDPIKLKDKLISIFGLVSMFWGIQVFNCEDNKLETSHGTFKGDMVFFTTGHHNFTNENCTSARAQAMALRCKLNGVDGNFSYASEGVYFKYEDSHLIIGGKRYEDLESENTNIDDINYKISTLLEEFVKNSLLSEFTIESRWSGILSNTTNSLPLIREIRPNCYTLNGMSGHGVAFSYPWTKDLVNSL